MTFYVCGHFLRAFHVSVEHLMSVVSKFRSLMKMIFWRRLIFALKIFHCSRYIIKGDLFLTYLLNVYCRIC